MSPVESAFVTQYSTYCVADDGDWTDGDDKGNDDKGDDDGGTNTDDDDKSQGGSDSSDSKSGHSHSDDSSNVNVGAAVGGTFGALAGVMILGGGAWFYMKKKRGEPGSYVPGVTTFSPFFGGDKPMPTFQQVKAEVSDGTELSSGSGNYVPVSVGDV